MDVTADWDQPTKASMPRASDAYAEHGNLSGHVQPEGGFWSVPISSPSDDMCDLLLVVIVQGVSNALSLSGTV
jgi:hypothetical protein